MKAYALNRGGNYCAWHLAEDIEQLFRSGSIDQNTPCKEHRAQRWRTVAEIFPLLEYERMSSRSLYRAHDVGCWESSDSIRRSNGTCILDASSQGCDENVLHGRRAMNAPWLERPRRLFRWLDMLKFSAEDFHNIGYSLGRLQSMLEISGEDEALDEKAAAVMKSNLLDIQKECSAIGLTMSVKSVQYVLSNLEEKRNCGFLKHAYGELNRRISDEIGDDLFFSVPKTHAQFYINKSLWK